MAYWGRKPKEETRRKMSIAHTKWTPEVLLPIMEMFKKQVKDNGYYYIGVMLRENGYSCHQWKDWKNKGGEIEKAMEDVEDLIETNLVEAVATGKIKETFGIFTLKSKHKWVDRQQVDHNVQGGLEININV